MSVTTTDRVIQIIRQATGVGPDAALDRDTPLVGAGIALDSVAVLELLVGIEKEFGIELHHEKLIEAKALRTVGTLADFVDGKRS